MSVGVEAANGRRGFGGWACGTGGTVESKKWLLEQKGGLALYVCDRGLQEGNVGTLGLEEWKLGRQRESGLDSVHERSVGNSLVTWLGPS